LPKSLLQFLPIVSPPLSIELLSQHFEHDHFITVYIVRVFLPESDGRRTDEGSDATEAVRQIFTYLVEVSVGKCLFMIVVQRQE
jgi:hypothetical protein